MAYDREERLLLRQRGAGRHKVKDVDFGFSIPAPPSSARSTRSVRSRRSVQHDVTPVVASNQKRRRTSRKTEVDVLDSSSDGVARNGQAAKQPGSGSEQNGEVGDPLQPPAKRPRRSLRNSVIVTIAEEASPESIRHRHGSAQPESISRTGGVKQSKHGEALMVSSNLGEDQYNPVAPLQPSNGILRRFRKRSVSSEAAEDQENLESALPEDVTPLIKRARGDPRRTLEPVPENDADEDDELAGASDREYFERARRAELAPRKQHSNKAEENLSHRDDLDDNMIEDPESPATARNPVKRKPQNRQQGGRASSNISPRPTQREKDRHARSRGQDFNASATSEAVKHTKASDDLVPIVVHRLRVPTHANDDEDSENDELVKPKFVRRGGVNAVDVLSQICRELVNKAALLMHRDESQENNDKRRSEWRRKRKVIEAFGEEFDSRCFALTEALDNNYALTIRVRQNNKKKHELREQLLNVRREREKIALKMDAIRVKHEEGITMAQRRNNLNTDLYDLELAVSRSREISQETSLNVASNQTSHGLEMLLKNVAEGASSSSPGRGLLRAVKDFNSFLERAATVLEIRAT